MVAATRRATERWRIGAGLGAAGAALAVVVALAWFAPRDPLRPSALAKVLIAPGGLAAVGEADWFEPRWTDAGSLKTSSSPRFDAAFRFGVQNLDLEAALRLGRIESAAVLAARQGGVLDGLGLKELAGEYRQLAAQLEALEAGDSVAALRRLSAGLAEEVAQSSALDPLSLTFGVWCEAGRFAGLGGNAKLLTSDGFRGFLQRLEPVGDWHPGVEVELERLRDLLQPELNDLQMMAIAVSFEAIVARG